MSQILEVLAIDDDLAFVGTLKTFFGDYGMKVATISDAVLSTAVDFGNFKVVLLDLDMPGMSGEEVLQRIVAADGRPTVIIVSSHSDLETRIKLLEQGADFFIAKPVDLTELLLISKRSMGRVVPEFEAITQWSLSRLQHTICSPTGMVFGLTSSEFLILEQLFGTCPDFVSKEKLVKAITTREGDAAFASFRSLEVMISRMRTRFSVTDHPLPIKALRNVGYVFHGHGKLTD